MFEGFVSYDVVVFVLYPDVKILLPFFIFFPEYRLCYHLIKFYFYLWRPLSLKNYVNNIKRKRALNLINVNTQQETNTRSFLLIRFLIKEVVYQLPSCGTVFLARKSERGTHKYSLRNVLHRSGLGHENISYIGTYF